MKNTMQICYWTIGGFDAKKPVEQALAEAKAMGYEGVELGFEAGVLGPDTSDADLKSYRAAAKKLGMKIESLCTGYYWGVPFTHADAKVRAKAVDFTKKYIHAAEVIGAKTILVIPGAVAVPWNPAMPVVAYADAWKRATACLKACVKTAEKAKVKMGLENVWNWFLYDPIAMRTFIDQFKSPYVGAYFDVANCLVNGYPEHWIEILGKRIAGVHFKNFERKDCAGGLTGFGDDLLKGAADWKKITAALEKVKYKGPITAEMIPFSRGDKLVLPDMKMAKDTAGKMKKILSK